MLGRSGTFLRESTSWPLSKGISYDSINLVGDVHPKDPKKFGYVIGLKQSLVTHNLLRIMKNFKLNAFDR